MMTNQNDNNTFTPGEIKGLICGIFGAMLLGLCVFRVLELAGIL